MCSLSGWQLTVSHWVNRRTVEQRQIDRYLSRTKGKTILFVGIGDSTLAKMLCPRNQMDGITASWPEKQKAESLGFSNYKVYLHDKFDPSLDKYLGHYDLVVDTNPGTYRCCDDHFKKYLETVFHHMNPGALFVSHTRGINHESPRIKLPGSVKQMSDILNKLGIKYVQTYQGRIVIYEKTAA